jgi:chromosomal replication initiator protein
MRQSISALSAYGAWRQICRVARAQISPAIYRACFTGTAGITLDADALLVAVPTATARDQIERRFGPLLAAWVQRALHRPLRLCFTIAPAGGKIPPARKCEPLRAESGVIATTALSAGQPQPAIASPLPDPDLNPRYTFASFIVGDSNRLAYAAAQNVAAAPGQSYNPLFLYGGVGLGKTHLLMAVGHSAAAIGLRVHYVTTETFTNEIVTAIQKNTQDAFRACYRAFDVLLVDDIQFIGGKERTEEEFFHTFNALHNANKQIVVTSDRPPRAIPTLHDRLRSRFEWGLLADIAAPDYAHRLAILRAKAAAQELPVPMPALEYLARPEGSSVRQLEGALNRLVMTARMRGTSITLALAAETLRDYFGERGRSDLAPEVVVALVAEHYHIAAADILGKSRTRTIAWPRQVAMYLLREETEQSLAQIGAALGGRDHTTIMHGCEQVAEMIQHDKHVQHEVETLRTTLRTL